MVGIMKATIGYACQPGYVVRKGDRVVVRVATNLPPSRGIDIFVARIDSPDNSIGATWSEVDIIDESEG